jgi:NADP-dependent 3-hydroxy acid dehydrogenase YdfG
MSKVWFITGAGRVIGNGIANAAIRVGDRVGATGRNLEMVRSALGDIASGNLALVKLDVTDERQTKAAVKEAVSHCEGRRAICQTSR